ncbi:hypothetical protein LguiA_032124 [Lonicera macranthoides]
MKQGLLSYSQFHSLLPIVSVSKSIIFPPISATLESACSFTARERRQLKNERREKTAYNWKEEVEERLSKKPRKRFNHWTEDLNLDYLAELGPQWWILKVYKLSCHQAAQSLTRFLAENYPQFEFKVYAPAVQVKTKLKNGTIAVKPKPLFSRCVFLRCVMNREIHDFVREVDCVAGFVGSKVGNTKKQINKPRPVDSAEMEAIFQKEKEEQEKHDKAFEEEQRQDGALDSNTNPDLASKDVLKPKRRSKKGSTTGKDGKLPPLGSTVRVVSGAFAEFSGTLKKLDCKEGMATVGFTLFGKETLADLDLKEIVATTN